MTQTQSARTQTAYRGVVYGIDVLDHFTRLPVDDDYVGKTRQRGRKRENQHRDDKPWSDLILGSSHVLWEGICTEDELDEIERRFIREKRPRMNDKDNRWNPDRIEWDEQVRQRHERDDALGRPRWQPPELRVRESLLDWDADIPVRSAALPSPASSWTPTQVKVCLWLTAWLLLAVLGWGMTNRYMDRPVQVDLAVAGLWSLSLLSWALCREPDSWKLWSRRLRKIRKALR